MDDVSAGLKTSHVKRELTGTGSGKKPVPDWGRRNSAGVNIASSMTFSNIQLELGGNQIIQDFSLEVEAGKILCLLGPSGSGKTSLLRIAAGLLPATMGSISIDGQIIADEHIFVPPEKRGIGMVFQDYALFPHLTVLENVEFGLTALASSESRNHALHMLGRVGLEHRASNYPHELSGGEQQRVALARALAPKPRILLMDEPFSGLDSRLREKVRDQSLEILKETRSTAIIVTHDAEEALRVADRIALVRGGSLVQEGSGNDLYNRPETLFAARFFSDLNVLPAMVDGNRLVSIFGAQTIKSGVHSGGWVAAVRHADFDIKPAGNKVTGIRAKVSNRQYVGRSELVGFVPLGIETPMQARVRAGVLDQGVSDIEVSVRPGQLMFFPQDQ